MSHHNHRSLSHLLLHGLLDEMLGLGVEGAGCLIQHEDLGLPQNGSGNGNPLILAATQSISLGPARLEVARVQGDVVASEASLVDCTPD